MMWRERGGGLSPPKIRRVAPFCDEKVGVPLPLLRKEGRVRFARGRGRVL